MTINLCGAIFAAVVFTVSGVAIAGRALRAQGRDRLILFVTACLAIAGGLMIVIFYIYDERILFPR
ncbi:MAG: hypothetical protein ACRD3W_29045 [Terriglobales bacterium]